MSESEIFLDVRTKEEYRLGCIPGAIQSDVLDEENFKKTVQCMDKERKYILYCRTENRSERAKEIMYALGFSDISILPGGYQMWRQNSDIEK